MALVLFDNKKRKQFFPLTATRAFGGLRMGILTVKERWEKITGEEVYIHTTPYLMPLYEAIPSGEHIWIDSTVIISDDLLKAIKNLKPNEAITSDDQLIVWKGNQAAESFDIDDTVKWFGKSIIRIKVERLEYPHQIFQWNDAFIKFDYKLITANRISQQIPASNNVINPSNIFLEEGVTMEFCTLNASTGPIYIGTNATLLEGCLVRGAFSLGSNSLLKMGTKIYGATTLGPNCVGGGEIKNIVMQANSNKAHDGYLGDSIIGEWCNFGAGTSNSNVKNTGGEVHLWNEAEDDFINAGQKCGLIMGDYSRAAINSSINTGSYIGVCCNVFGAGLLPKVIKDFSWGLKDKYVFNKALSDINNWKKMKNQELSQEEIDVLKYIFGAIGG
jgi:UDP-N-acetylglucosamine diphosphorylase/glucosamine-1-phosphate N-acetyltransferase